MNNKSLSLCYEDLSDRLDSYTLPVNLTIPKFVAEIGCNHGGKLGVAKQMIVVAKTCGADVAKFQKRSPRELLTSEQYHAPYDNPHSFGRTYGEHREALEFDASTHRLLKACCEEHGIEYSTSVWDVTSACEIISLKPNSIKVPSACNNNIEMLELLRDEYDGDVHISTGMTTREEIDRAIAVFHACPERIVLYACTSAYPAGSKDVCLLEIVRLVRHYKQTDLVREIGFSGHHNGIALDAIAPLLGATIIERHFTLDRTSKGSDHAASLEPAGFARITRNARQIAEAWTLKSTDILPVEVPQRNKLKYRSRFPLVKEA